MLVSSPDRNAAELTMRRRTFLALAASLALAACASTPQVGPSQPPGEGMVAAADARAVDAGLEMLRKGGTATDAAIATMLVLGLVEPQSAGLGGGGFLLAFDKATRDFDSYDGRETAPAGARAELFLKDDGAPLGFRDAAWSGLSTGAPSLMPMLEMAHREHGRLPWRDLFEPAIKLAEEGFIVSPRMAALLGFVAQGPLKDDPEARAYFFDAEGKPLTVGARRTNPAYAEALRALQSQGGRALTRGPIAQKIVAAVQREPRGGSLTLADLASVQPRRIDPLCAPYRTFRVCSMAPPSSGGVAVLSALGLYERARPAPVGANDPDDWSAFIWASRLAYADRDHYIGDDRFVPVPTQGLIDPRYLDARAKQIDTTRAAARVEPGDPSTIVGGASLLGRWGRDATGDIPGTTHLSVVDGYGNAVALTATVEGPFGSQRMASGFMLNNQLTDFSLAPTKNGKPVANAPGPRKKPRSSMAPAIVFDREGNVHAVIGSPGGSAIIGYVAKTLIGLIDWNLSMQEAISLPNTTARSADIRIERQRMAPGTYDALAARGWKLTPTGATEASGLHGIRVTPQGLEGGADPRREGVAKSTR
jgi:gamma-glutamyltranspeptidase/glutathione hydrolase